jgi:ATP-binding cassette subfamily B protein
VRYWISICKWNGSGQIGRYQLSSFLSLHEVIKDRTTIVIAHRLSTLKDMDRILVFVKGKIVEDGSLDSLLADKKSHFYKLWHMQAGGFIPPVVG